MLTILKFVPILICSLMLGHCFFSEVKKAKMAGSRWFVPYLTIPGILILVSLTAPLFIYLFR